MKALGLLGAAGLLTGTATAREQDDRERDDEDDEPSADRHGPLKTGLFEVQIDEVEVLGWQRVTIPRSPTEQGEHREGDESDWEKKVSGQVTFDDLEMERGVEPGDSRIWDWRTASMENPEEGRKEIAVTLEDERGEPQLRWTFLNAWVKEYDPPELDAAVDGDVVTERIIVTFDRMVEERRVN